MNSGYLVELAQILSAIVEAVGIEDQEEQLVAFR